MSKTLAYTDEAYRRRRAYAALDWTYRTRGDQKGAWKAELVREYMKRLRPGPAKA